MQRYAGLHNKRFLLFAGLLALSGLLQAQAKIFPNRQLMAFIKTGVDKSYNYEFDDAEKIFNSVLNKTPGHPVGPLLYGLLYYYKYYPLTPDNPHASEFVKTLEESIELSDRMLEKDKNDPEAIAHAMIGRALLNMYFVDNGLTMQAFAGARPLYKVIMKGCNLLDQSNEFYFTTGLYNYYIIAYPEAHPIYKPLVSFFQPGNKQLGLKQIHYAADSCILLKPEALLYLKYIYINYENNPEKAIECSRRLYKLYPHNRCFISEYAESLLIYEDYEQAKPLIYLLLTMNKDDYYMLAKGLVFKGIYEEKVNKNYATAKKNYLGGLKIAELYGPQVNALKAHACFGLSRVYTSLSDPQKAKEYYNLGKSYANYPYLYKLNKN